MHANPVHANTMVGVISVEKSLFALVTEIM